MNPIIGVFAIAGMTVVCTACTEDEKRGTSSILASLNINDPVGKLSSPAPAVAYVTEVVEEPKVAWEEVCWIELHRGGTMEVRVCENRVVNP